jgi:hypothetical protein
VTRDWQTHCVTFVAQRDFRYIQLKPAAGYSTTTGVFIDNLVPVANCTPDVARFDTISAAVGVPAEVLEQ